MTSSLPSDAKISIPSHIPGLRSRSFLFAKQINPKFRKKGEFFAIYREIVAHSVP